MKNGKKSQILIVDDEPDILLILGEFLSNEGFRVLTAKNGKQAVEKVKEYPVDLILLDMAMPELNGIEALKQVKAIKPELPAIMITAYRDAEKVVEAFRLGAYDCIFKPFDLKYLRKSILAQLME
ncbi:MAG: response regulator [Elusimicrobia bacterium]|nr:response regulator [Candidatus Liberimonas magnetica]